MYVYMNPLQIWRLYRMIVAIHGLYVGLQFILWVYTTSLFITSWFYVFHITEPKVSTKIYHEIETKEDYILLS